MPPRDRQLPEGTDQVIAGASRTDGDTGGSASGTTQVTTTGQRDAGGFVAKSGDNGQDGSATDKLVSQVREQVSSLRGQAGDKLRGMADDGKGKAASLLDDLREVIDEAARAIDQRFGEDYGSYAHRASGAVASFNDRLRDKTVDDLLDDTREVVRKSPGIAIGIAAVAGFALMRIVKSGMDDVRGKPRSGGGSGGNGGASA